MPLDGMRGGGNGKTNDIGPKIFTPRQSHPLGRKKSNEQGLEEGADMLLRELRSAVAMEEREKSPQVGCSCTKGEEALPVGAISKEHLGAGLKWKGGQAKEGRNEPDRGENCALASSRRSVRTRPS